MFDYIGTFKVVPQPFTQLTTFNFFVYRNFAEAQQEHNIRKLLCSLYILCTHKDQFIYEMIFNQLRVWTNNRGIVIRWRRVMMDNETAMINAIRIFIPEIRISLCYFHVCQAIQRWITTHGLSVVYKRHGDFYNFVRILRSLALLPEGQVMNVYRNELNDLYIDALQDLINFFYPGICNRYIINNHLYILIVFYEVYYLLLFLR